MNYLFSVIHHKDCYLSSDFVLKMTAMERKVPGTRTETSEEM